MQTLSVKTTPVKTKSFECMDACVTSGGVTLRMLVVYRLHPKHKKNGINNGLFFEEFDDILSKHIVLPCKLLVLGDFNIHWNKPTDGNTLKLNDILDSFQLKQHVSSGQCAHPHKWEHIRPGDQSYGRRSCTRRHSY